MNLWFHTRRSANMWLGEPFDVAQHKLDGWRATFFVQERSAVEPVIALGRGEELRLEFFKRFPRLHDHEIVQRIKKMPPKTSVDVEICTERGCRSDVTTALRDPSIPLVITAFGVPYCAGDDLESTPLALQEKICLSAGVPFAPFIHKAKLSEVFAGLWTKFDDEKLDADEFKRCRELLLGLSAARSVEGWILKRGTKWYKVKPEETCDAVVTGSKDGEGKYTGQVGALTLSVYDPDGQLVEIANCSGMTDQERREMTFLREHGQLHGRVVEVEYQLLGSGMRLTHPRFKRWRADKQPEMCITSQLRGWQPVIQRVKLK